MFFLCISGITYASSHSHNGRVHSHPLPIEGVAHQHGNGAIGSDSSSDNSPIVTNSTQATQNNSFSSIGKDDFMSLIKGNTLILESSIGCSDGGNECIAIALLKDNFEAITIYPNRKSVVKDTWGLTTVGLAKTALDIGFTKIPVDYQQYPWNEIVKVNSSGTIIKLNNPGKKAAFNIVIEKGVNNKYSQLARSKNYEEINNIGKLTVAQALMGRALTGATNAIREAASVPSPSYPFCGASDTCYKLIKFKKSGSAVVQCTKGPSTGQEKCLGFNKNTGKYASGCGITDIGAHHYTLEKAGNSACEY